MSCVIKTCDPHTYAYAHGQLECDNAIIEKLCSLMKNKTWDLVPQLQGKNIVKCQWVQKTKFTSHGVVERHKPRLVLNGFFGNKASTTLKPFPLLYK